MRVNISSTDLAEELITGSFDVIHRSHLGASPVRVEFCCPLREEGANLYDDLGGDWDLVVVETTEGGHHLREDLLVEPRIRRSRMCEEGCLAEPLRKDE